MGPRLALLVALCLGAWWAGPAPVVAQAGRELDVRPGFDGLGKAGRWLPVRVTVANDGPGFVGEVRLVTRVPGGGPSVAYSQALELPSRSRKLVHLAAPATSAAGDLRVELAADGQEIAARGVPVRLLAPGDFLVGVLAEDEVPPAGLGSLRRGGGQVSVARVRPDELPSDPLQLQVLDALVVRNAAADRLRAEQRAALRAWIEAGGQLVVAGGPGWRRTIDGLDDLLPVEGLWSREIKHLRALSRYAGVAPPEGSLLVTIGSPIEGARVLLTQDSIPLVVERWLGQGRVTWLAADPALEPFRSWPAAESLWQRVLVGGRPLFAVPDEAAAGTLEPHLRAVLGGLVDAGLPSPAWLALFLLVYILVAGPLQYVLLRRWDRREWAWVGFPALAASFAIVAYFGGTWLRGPDWRMAALSIIRSPPAAQMASVDTFVAVVAPTRRTYDLDLLDQGSPRLLFGRGGLAGDRAVVQLGPPTRLPGLRLEGRTLQAIHSRAVAPAPTPAQAELRASGGRLEGLVRNVGPDRLGDALLLAGGEALPLGDIGPGESRPVSLALPTTRGNGGPIVGAGGAIWTDTATGALVRQRALVQSLLQSGRGADGESAGGALLVAWVAATPPRVAADGVPIGGTAARLVQQALPIGYGDGAIAIPPGLLGRTILDGAALSRGGAAAFALRGPIVFQYDLPPDIAMSRVDRLSVHLALGPRGAPSSAPTGAGSPRISLYRWPDRTWVDVPIGASGVGDAAFGAQFVDGDAIRLRVEPTAPETWVQQLDLSIEGVR